MANEPQVNFPQGDPDVQTLADAATMTQDIVNMYTVLKKTGGFAQAVTGLSLRASKDLRIGARVKVDIAQSGTGRNVTFGAAASTIVAPALTGVADDRDVIMLEWNGSAFEAVTAWQKIVDAA